MTEILDAMTRPDSNGTPALPKKKGRPKGAAAEHLAREDAAGVLRRLLRRRPGNNRHAPRPLPGRAGPEPERREAKALISWDRLTLVELIED